jgi:predicted RNase H-like HicB family nuclease
VIIQGKTKEEAFANLRETLKMHFKEPRAAILPEIRHLEVQLNDF